MYRTNTVRRCGPLLHTSNVARSVVCQLGKWMRMMNQCATKEHCDRRSHGNGRGTFEGEHVSAHSNVPPHECSAYCSTPARNYRMRRCGLLPNYFELLLISLYRFCRASSLCLNQYVQWLFQSCPWVHFV